MPAGRESSPRTSTPTYPLLPYPHPRVPVPILRSDRVAQLARLTHFAIVHRPVAILLEPLHSFLAERKRRPASHAQLLQLIRQRVELAVVVAGHVHDAEAAQREVP
jgi:hypothetical protein